jgi:hypothetical protein
MNYHHCWILFAVLTFAALIIVGSGAGGCIDGGTFDEYSCPAPIYDRLDSRGKPDPCCEREPYCCEHPIPEYNDANGIPDPCCNTTPCPELRKLLWPDAGEASDASSDG